MSKNEEELSVIREPSTEVNEEGGDDKGVRYAITGHTEQEIDAELEKLEEGSIAKGGRRIFSSTLFGNPKYFIWVLASFASMGGILYGIDQSLISGAGLYVPTDLNYGSNKESMISGFMPLGGIFGAIMVYPTNELIGRKWSIIGACLLYTVGESAKGRFIWLDFINKPRCRHAAQYAIILMIIQQFSGINSVNYYMGTLMHETGLTKQQAVYTSMIGGGTGFLSTIPAIYLMDRLGRRTLLLSLISGVFIGLLIIGFSFLSSSTHTKEGIYIWGVVIYYLFWGSCLGPTPWVVGSEVWPTYLRSQGLFLTDITNWTGDFITTYAFPHMTAAMTNEGTFCGFYAGIVLIGTFYLMLFMPETKDKTLEELDQVFEQPLSDLMAENIQKLKETWDDLKSFRFSRVWALSK
ncbi:Inositol transporter 1 [Galdieria sulphuraria]|nr:Inositol transporter 1 [Galdieria sulphuraria]